MPDKAKYERVPLVSPDAKDILTSEGGDRQKRSGRRWLEIGLWLLFLEFFNVALFIGGSAVLAWSRKPSESGLDDCESLQGHERDGPGRLICFNMRDRRQIIPIQQDPGLHQRQQVH